MCSKILFITWLLVHEGLYSVYIYVFLNVYALQNFIVYDLLRAIKVIVKLFICKEQIFFSQRSDVIF
jgi:hypothetical protein